MGRGAGGSDVILLVFVLLGLAGRLGGGRGLLFHHRPVALGRVTDVNSSDHLGSCQWKVAIPYGQGALSWFSVNSFDSCIFFHNAFSLAFVLDFFI